MDEFELTRFILAFICGYFLTVSGSLSQLVTNNSIASPSTLGMDGMAVLFVILSQFVVMGDLSISLSLESLSFIAISLLCATCYVFFFLVRHKKFLASEINIQKLILFGLAFNLFVGAIFSIIQFLFMALNFEFPTGLWFGSLKQAESDLLPVFMGVFILIQIIFSRLIKKLEILNLGSDFALGVGINVSRIQGSSLIISMFLTGLVISYLGVFSFLGLIFPHILRSFNIFKTNMKMELMLGSYLCGFIFAIVDQFCFYGVVYGAELPVGMVSSVFGAFFLIFLVLRSRINRI